MAVGVVAGSLADALTVPAVILIVAGLAVSRVWTWEVDPVEDDARRGPVRAAATAWSRWGEIVAGGLFTLGLGALVLDAEPLAVGAGITLAVWIGVLVALDKPPA
jgi:fermentation-respiration switch protein FrsA (DUF1100 family)